MHVSWIKYAKFGGEATLGPEYGSRTCNFWNLSTPSIALSLCMDNNDTRPVLWTVEGGNLTEFYYFWPDFQPVQPDPSHFVVPKSCFEKSPLCDNGTVAELDAFIFHPAHQFDLINEVFSFRCCCRCSCRVVVLRSHFFFFFT